MIAALTSAAARTAAAALNHLWTATLAALALGFLALALRRWLGPRTRHALLLLSVLPLVLPVESLARLPELLGWSSSRLHLLTASEQARLAASVLAPPSALTATSSAGWQTGALALWVSVALALVALFVAQTLRSRRELEAAGPAGPAAQEAAARLCARLSILAPRIVTASAAARVSVVGIWRQTIVLPAGLEDELSTAELESILAHEIAHLRSRDNLAAALFGFAAASFWFHPLAWLLDAAARRERELACDEAVLRAGIAGDTFLGALLKVCRRALGPAAFAAVSGMPSRVLATRRRSLMQPTIDRFRLPHRATWIAALALLVCALAVWPNRSAAAPPASATGNYLRFAFAVNAVSADADAAAGPARYAISVLVVDPHTLELIAAPTVLAGGGTSVQMRVGPSAPDERTISVDVIVDEHGTGKASYSVDDHGKQVQSGSVPLSLAVPSPGEPIYLSLRAADLREVLKTFGQISGTTMLIPEDLQGKVDVELDNVAWADALRRILEPQGYGFRRVEDLVAIYRLEPGSS
jgi:beta-lactamase regulating signal transducer with metallopeptidase domain